MISQSDALAPEEIEVHQHQRDLSALSSTTGGIFLTGGTRASVTPGKTHSKEGKYINP